MATVTTTQLGKPKKLLEEPNQIGVAAQPRPDLPPLPQLTPPAMDLPGGVQPVMGSQPTETAQPFQGAPQTTTMPSGQPLPAGALGGLQGAIQPVLGSTPPASLPVNGTQPVLTPYQGPAGAQAVPTPQLPQQAFGPGNDLRFQQINPVASERQQQTAGQVDQARNAVSGAAGYTPASDTARARQLTSQGLESLQGPDRTQLARQALDQFVADQNIAYGQRTQDVGRNAAAFGRIGSGMAADDVQRLGRSREQELIAEQGRLARDTASQQLSDRQAQLDAARGVSSDFAGQDLNAADFNRSGRLSTLNALSGLEGQQYGQDASNQAALRGERGYQSGVGQQAIDNAARQQDMESAAQQSEFNRNASRAGYGLTAAGQEYDIGQQQASDAAGSLEQLAQRQAIQRASQGSGNAPPTGGYSGNGSDLGQAPGRIVPAQGGPPMGGPAPVAASGEPAPGSPGPNGTLYIPGMGYVPADVYNQIYGGGSF